MLTIPFLPLKGSLDFIRLQSTEVASYDAPENQKIKIVKGVKLSRV